MSAVRDIRRKIKSIEGTKKITRAMEMVAASKMKKAQSLMIASRPYAQAIREVINHVLNSQPDFVHPLFEEREKKNIGYIVISSKRGLCGGLNINLFKKVLDRLAINQEQGQQPNLCLFGAKSIAFFKKVQCPLFASLEPIGDLPSIEELIGLIGVALVAFENKDIDELYICYNNFEGMMKITPTLERLLPFSFSKEKNKDKLNWDYIYEPDSLSVLDRLLTRYIEAIIYQSVLENYTCEQASRMLAMKSATDNATGFIDALKVAYNKARQALITKEISEIVGGAAALSDEEI